MVLVTWCVRRWQVLVFVNSRAGTEELAKNITGMKGARCVCARAVFVYITLGDNVKYIHNVTCSLPPAGAVALSLHGDKAQSERDDVVAKFRCVDAFAPPASRLVAVCAH